MLDLVGCFVLVGESMVPMLVYVMESLDNTIISYVCARQCFFWSSSSPSVFEIRAPSPNKIASKHNSDAPAPTKERKERHPILAMNDPKNAIPMFSLDPASATLPFLLLSLVPIGRRAAC